MGKPWSRTELGYLRQNYRKISTRLMAEDLGKSIPSIHSMAHLVGATQPAFEIPPRTWTPDEDGIMLALYGTLRPEELAQTFGRTISSVHHRGDKLGLFSSRYGSEFRRRQSLPRKGQPFPGLPDPATAGYIAGIIDGEGSILGPPRVTISVTTTTKALAMALRSIAGGTVAGPYLYADHKRFGNQSYRLKPQYHWNFASQYHVYLLLKRIRPFLVVEVKEADRGIRYFERGLKWRIE